MKFTGIYSEYLKNNRKELSTNVTCNKIIGHRMPEIFHPILSAQTRRQINSTDHLKIAEFNKTKFLTVSSNGK